MEKVRRFKFLRDGLRSDYNGYQWDIGVWHTTECKELCHGFNCSRRIVDAIQYVSGEILAEVEVRGKHFDDKDKSTHAEMRIIKALKWTQADSVSLAIYAARLVLDVYESAYPGDDRPRIAIEAAERWLADPSVENQAAAGDAAGAAEAAAGAAAGAAGAAAWAAARAAGDAAEAAIESYLLSRLDQMEGWS